MPGQEPFHMSEDDAALPEGTELPENRLEVMTSQVVDTGSIQTYPKIDYAEHKVIGKGLASFARLSEDGRIVISFNLTQNLPDLPEDYAKKVNEFAVDAQAWRDVPRLNIVIMIVGGRGDVQPYLALAKKLKEDGHRIRIATHETFRSFVKYTGFEFFCIGGDPKELMSYMVKNPGLVPGMGSLLNDDIGRKRKMLTEMINGCWKSCYEPDDESGAAFAVDAIISNPHAFAHVHCAEALGVPLLLSFTTPWSPTMAFPHPLVYIKQSNVGNGLTNYLSYALVDIMTWKGIGDIVNKFRTETLGLKPLTLRTGPGLVDRLKIPWTYCMSPTLMKPPKDWKNHIDVVGFYFLDLASDYEPAYDLSKFLSVGPPPVYIGFGSVVVDDPKAMTKIIFKAVKRAGVRALVSVGWGGLGGVEIPPDVFILDNVPHDWLFEKVSAVVHHGGAGTTAIGLKKGCPTVVVPFFGDQHFWGMMIHKAGAGPEPIPHKELNIKNLGDAIKFAVSPRAKAAAQRMAQLIEVEDGVKQGVDSFYKHLPLLNMRCDLDPTRLAVWWSTKYYLKMSAYTARILADARLIDMKDLDEHRSKEYNATKTVTDPITGGVSAVFWMVTNFFGGFSQIFYDPVKGAIETTVAIPKGVADIVLSVHQGFHNVPKLYGSEVREPGEVTGFISGLKEGGTGLFYGLYDGITGLVREPVKGAQEGFMGVVKGAAKSFVNVAMKPAAGALGVVVHPARGAWKSVERQWAMEQAQFRRQTRLSDGVREVYQTRRADRLEIIKKFQDLESTIKERQSKYENLAKREIYGDGY